MSGSDGISRLRKAVDNQASLGEAAFTLPIGEMLAMLDECEDELAALSWAEGVTAPVDADGEVVPLDTTELYTDDGEIICVNNIRFNGYSWLVGTVRKYGLYRLDELHCTHPDTWEKLEKDVFALVVALRVKDPGGDVKKCILRAKALAERDAKGADRG